MAEKFCSKKIDEKIWNIRGNTIELDASANSKHPLQTTFDHVFSPEISENQIIFEKMVKNLVDGAIEGLNGTTIAYGQTSSGKTYTMLGDEKNPGVIPCALEYLFKEVNQLRNIKDYNLRLSYLEIYNETISDLLANPDGGNHCNLKIHESLTRGVFVGGLAEEPVSSSNEAIDLLRKGQIMRHVEETNLNERSSRSHTILRVLIESRQRSETSIPSRESFPVGSVCCGTLTFVDLAGSEKARLTGAEGLRLKESGHINKSLLALTTVVSKLAEGRENLHHVPYRDSKLTRILQGALGGNGATSIICTVNSLSENLEETVSTLKFGTRAKNVKTKPRVNEVYVSDRDALNQAQTEIATLRHQIHVLTQQSCNNFIQNEPDNCPQKNVDEMHISTEAVVDSLNVSCSIAGTVGDKCDSNLETNTLIDNLQLKDSHHNQNFNDSEIINSESLYRNVTKKVKTCSTRDVSASTDDNLGLAMVQLDEIKTSVHLMRQNVSLSTKQLAAVIHRRMEMLVSSFRYALISESAGVSSGSRMDKKSIETDRVDSACETEIVPQIPSSSVKTVEIHGQCKNCETLTDEIDILKEFVINFEERINSYFSHIDGRQVHVKSLIEQVSLREQDVSYLMQTLEKVKEESHRSQALFEERIDKLTKDIDEQIQSNQNMEEILSSSKNLMSRINLMSNRSVDTTECELTRNNSDIHDQSVETNLSESFEDALKTCNEKISDLEERLRRADSKYIRSKLDIDKLRLQHQRERRQDQLRIQALQSDT